MIAPIRAPQSTLQAREITVVRGGRHLLNCVNLDIRPGRILAVIGPNGAGKSTLLRVISGELRPDAGTIDFLDRPAASWSAQTLARRRAVLPQDSSLSFPFQVSEVVRLGRVPHRGCGGAAHEKSLIESAIREVGLHGFSERLYTTLSGGEKQRVHLARALVQLEDTSAAERLLLLDEPTASLDPAHQHAVLRLARRQAESGAAVLAVLHDLNLALTYADDVVALKNGSVVASGPVDETLSPELIQELFSIPARRVVLSGFSRPQLILGTFAS